MNVRRIAVAGLLVVTAFSFAQQPPAKKEAKGPVKPAPGSLEDTLDKALRSSADIHAAEAKVRDAEAELNRARQQVLAKTTAVYSDLQSAVRMLKTLEELYSLADAAVKRGVGGHSELLAARLSLEKQRAEIEKLDSQLKTLRGEFAVSSEFRAAVALADRSARFLRRFDDAVALKETEVARDRLNREAAATGNVQSAMADRIFKLLDTEVAITEFPSFDVPDILETTFKLAKQSDVPYRFLPEDELRGSKFRPTEGRISIAAHIQSLEDSQKEVICLIRDYGLLITTKDRAPEGAVRAYDFWKARSQAKLAEKK